MLFSLSNLKKRSKSSKDNSTEPEALVIFNLGQSLGSQPGLGKCIVINYLKVKWKSNMLILYREYIILCENLEVLSAPFESLLTDT